MAIEVRVTHLSGSRKDDVDTFRKLPIRLGRADSCALQFDPERDVRVSAVHAELREQSGLLELIDLGSQNGTTVNGLALSEGPITVPNHAVVQLGEGGPRVRVEYQEGGAISFARDEQPKVAPGKKLVPTDRRKIPELPAQAKGGQRLGQMVDELSRNGPLLLVILAVALAAALGVAAALIL